MSTTNGLVVVSAWVWSSMLTEAVDGCDIAVVAAEKSVAASWEDVAQHIFQKKRMFWQRQPTIEECRREALRGEWRIWTMSADCDLMAAHSFRLRVKEELTNVTTAYQRYEVKEYHVDSNFYGVVLRHGKKFREIEKRRKEEKDAKPETAA